MSYRTRRSFLKSTIGGSIAAGGLAAAPTNPIRLGGPIFLKSQDPRELAKEHRRLGYAAAYCPQLESKDGSGIAATRAAFASENVVISEVGAWRNILDPNSEKRRENLQYVTERMHLADEVHALCCVDIAGSFNPTVWYGADPKNLSKEFFDATVENCRKIIDAVKPIRSKFSIEMMPWSLPDSPDAYVKLVHAIDRRAFGVHLDVCNIINSPARFYRSGDVITECFQKLGKWVLSCHAKDLQWIPEYNVHFKEVVPGQGRVDYKSYLTNLAALPKPAPLMMEHLAKPEEYLEGAEHIKRVGHEAGITFV